MARRRSSFGASGAGKREFLCVHPGARSDTRWQGRFASAVRKLARLTLFAVLNCSLCRVSFGGDISLRNPARTRPVSNIPFKAYEGYLIVVDGRIGNLEHQNLLLDTGTNPSLIDRRVAANLGLKATPRDLSVFNKSVASENVTLPDLEFGPMRRENLPVIVADFSAIGSGLGTRIDAVIGLDVLGGTNFTIDYAKRRIFFGASVEHHTVPFTAGQQFITVNLMSGGRQLHLLLDTGTPQLVLFESHLRGVDYEWTGVTGSGRNASGSVRFGAVVLPEASIGKLEMGPQRASVVTTQKGIDNDLDGLMGVSCLRPRRISFDFERQVLGWSD